MYEGVEISKAVIWTKGFRFCFYVESTVTFQYGCTAKWRPLHVDNHRCMQNDTGVKNLLTCGPGRATNVHYIGEAIDGEDVETHPSENVLIQSVNVLKKRRGLPIS